MAIAVNNRDIGPLPVHGILVGSGVFALCLIGILSRPHFDLATFWPANAFMLGMLVRFPKMAGPSAWISCAVGFFMADALTGADPVTNFILNGGNLTGIAAGYWLLASLPPEDRMLQRPAAIFYLLRAVIFASFVTGLSGMVANPVLFGGTSTQGFTFWFATEAVNYTAFLPMLLTLPATTRLKPTAAWRWFVKIDPRRTLPLLALIASAAAAAMVGGPGAIAFPVPALLWCAFTYELFGTTCLAFAFGAWTLLAIRTGIMSVGDDFESRGLLTSLRVGVTFVALTPLIVGSIMAARNALLERLQFLADRDAMTGLRNRRAFLEVGASALVTSLDDAKSAVVMMLDIDHFKSINDRFGHEAGDRVLCAFSGILERNLRPQDTLGRIGGEEFAILLPDCSLEQAIAVAGRINAILRTTPIALASGETVTVTVSIGVHIERDERNLEQLLKRADKALYQAKNSGRDRFELSPEASR
ncbi:MAG: sensor domain-containing diguanylate cyclase [Sphingomonadales bacterium]|nr:MAG: sensor domain-containing diguanylate cyclase [Sphingomonadales bacterium]